MIWLRICLSRSPFPIAPVNEGCTDRRQTNSLNATIQETLRIHSTSSLGLPRLVPPGPGVELAGHHFPQNVSLSVPAYTIHHSAAIWNPKNDPAFDPEKFNPDRWLDDRQTDLQKVISVFHHSPDSSTFPIPFSPSSISIKSGHR